MTSLAGRRRRRRRVLVTAGLAASVVVAAGALGLWVRAEDARREATSEALRQEAAQLLSLGRLRLADRRSEALAYAIASLERAENEPARRFALEVLWDGPTERVFGTEEYGNNAAFSPDGRWVATGGMRGAWLWSREGGAPRELKTSEGFVPRSVWFADGELVVVGDPADNVLRVFSVQDARQLRVIAPRAPVFPRGDRVVALANLGGESRVVQAWPLDGGEPRNVGAWDIRELDLWGFGSGAEFVVGPTGELGVEARNGVVAVRRLDTLDPVRRVLGQHDGARVASFDPSGRTVLSANEEEIRIWPLEGPEHVAPRTLRVPGLGNTWGSPKPGLDPSGRSVVAMVQAGDGQADIECMGDCTWSRFDLGGPPGHEPQAICRGYVQGFAFDPSGDWLVSPRNRYLSLWSLKGPRSYAIPFPGLVAGPVFSPDGRSIAAATGHEIRLWPTTPEAGVGVRLLHSEPGLQLQEGLAFDPQGRFVVATAPYAGTLVVVPLPTGPARHLSVPGTWGMFSPGVSPDGALVAAGYVNPTVPGSARVGVWDVETGERRDLDARAPGEDCGPGGVHEGAVYHSSGFLPDGRLITEGMTGLRLWDLEKGTSERLRDCVAPYSLSFLPLGLALTPDGRHAVTLASAPEEIAGAPPSRLTVFDLETRESREITSHGHRLQSIALDPTGRILVTHGWDDILRVGSLSGEEPHLLIGDKSSLMEVAVSPDGKWVGSGADGIRLWPMPDLTRPPFHRLPLDELLSRLRTHTNLRVVPDPGAEDGYRVEPGPFPGWASAPEW